jgi:hypothetical protein
MEVKGKERASWHGVEGAALQFRAPKCLVEEIGGGTRELLWLRAVKARFRFYFDRVKLR